MNINNQQDKHSVFLKYLFQTGKSFNTNISLKSLILTAHAVSYTHDDGKKYWK